MTSVTLAMPLGPTSQLILILVAALPSPTRDFAAAWLYLEKLQPVVSMAVSLSMSTY